MTTHSQVWHTDFNRIPVQTTRDEQSRWMLWYLKAALKGSGLGISTHAGNWTVEGSSDSTTAGMDGTDRWTDSYDSTKIIFSASAGGARSWIVLKSPAAYGLWLCLDYVSTAGIYVNAILARAAFTGGSASARPTSAKEHALVTRQLVEGALAAMHVHSSLSENGQFWFLSNRDGTGSFTSAYVIWNCTDTRTGDIGNGYSYSSYDTGGGLLARSTFDATRITSRRTDNTDVALTGAVFPSSVQANYPLMAAIGTVDAADSKYPDFPIHIHTTTIGSNSIRGRIPDVFWAPVAASDGSVEPVGGPYTSMIAGDVWLPLGSGITIGPVM